MSFIQRQFGREGNFRVVAAPLHRALIAQELLVERLIDGLSAAPSPVEPLLRQLTALIKTFERPSVLRRLVASMKRLYPALDIVVVDDSRDPAPLEGVKTITMPYNSGISAGRNEGLRHLSTRYVLILDDDVVLYRRTRLGNALALMERHPEIDIMGGQLIELPFFDSRLPPNGLDGIYPTDARPASRVGSSIGGLTVCAKVPNFFIARSERLALVPWDPGLKLLEHGDFFTRAFGVLTTVFNPSLKCFHARTPFDAEYMRSRLDLTSSGQILAQRYEGG